MQDVLFMSDPAILATRMVQRTKLLLRMREQRLNIDWAKAFSLSQLNDCCDRMAKMLEGISVVDQNLQKELIRNPAFAGYYAALIQQFPEEPTVEPDPEPCRTGYRYPQGRPSKPAASPRSRRSVLIERLSSLVVSCWENDCDITTFPIFALMETLELDSLYSRSQLVYLRNFAPLHLSTEERETVVENLSRCNAVPSLLSDMQEELLFEPFVGTRHLFATADFGEACALLESCPKLLDIARSLHTWQIHDDLQIEQYQAFAGAPSEYLRLMTVIFTKMEPQVAESFLDCWERSGYPLRELQIMAQRITAAPDMDLDAVFSNYPGYVNLLYGQRFKQIDLSDVNSYQEDVLLYAIAHQKKHFIRLVDEHSQDFLRLPKDSPLFVRKLYDEHFNLNELTASNLEACAWMSARRLHLDRLTPGRLYTFPELQTLYDVPDAYVTVYDLLTLDRQDDRLKVIKQLLKRNVLEQCLEDQELASLAAYLSQKPLYDWMQEDFGHISGLQAPDTVQLLLHLDQVKHLLPSMRDRTDVLLALRSGEQLTRFITLDELKEDLIQTDTGWHELSDAMGLSVQFCTQHRDTIQQFLCQNGAYIANVYRNNLSHSQEKAFLRVVKAELMGQLCDLKYYEGDLQRELDFPLTEHAKTYWRENTQLVHSGMIVQERDDFFATMLLGVQPKRTCLSYKDGAYNQCLLAGFDSNKKVLYATRGGVIVGRAYLRLTKGRLTRSDRTDETGSRFTFVDLEAVNASRQENTRTDERLTLFLERPYTSGLDPEGEQQVKAMFTELVTRKANALGAVLVLSLDYQGTHTDGFAWTQFDIYISKTKAGAQYLDSLNGQATVSSEGSYQSNSFLVLEYPSMKTSIETE